MIIKLNSLLVSRNFLFDCPLEKYKCTHYKSFEVDEIIIFWIICEKKNQFVFYKICTHQAKVLAPPVHMYIQAFVLFSSY